MKTRLKRIAVILLLAGIAPAVGPVYLGLVRDDIHAHSGVGDKGLQLITISGFLVLLAGTYLFWLSGKSFSPPRNQDTRVIDRRRGRGAGVSPSPEPEKPHEKGLPGS